MKSVKVYLEHQDHTHIEVPTLFQEEAELQRKIEDYRDKVEKLKSEEAPRMQTDTVLMRLSGRHVKIFFPNKQHTLVSTDFNCFSPTRFLETCVILNF